jgi:hypothetical protein
VDNVVKVPEHEYRMPAPDYERLEKAQEDKNE